MPMQKAFRLEEEVIEKAKEVQKLENRPTLTNAIETLLYEALMARFPKWKPQHGPGSR